MSSDAESDFEKRSEINRFQSFPSSTLNIDEEEENPFADSVTLYPKQSQIQLPKEDTKTEDSKAAISSDNEDVRWPTNSDDNDQNNRKTPAVDNTASGKQFDLTQSLERLDVSSDPLSMAAASESNKDAKDVDPSSSSSLIQMPGNDAESNNNNNNNYQEKDAMYYYNITVCDPRKVSDVGASHVDYRVITKTNDPRFEQSDLNVQRRYRDFLWLYQTLSESNPGIIVPPPPEKQAIGRFDESLIESRKVAFELMLSKIGKLPILANDPAFVVFLSSETFSVDQKHSNFEKSNITERRNTGIMSSLGLSSSLKFVEPDEWFLDKSTQIDHLHAHFLSIQKAIANVIKQKTALSSAALDVGQSMAALSGTELDRGLGECLCILAEVHGRLQEVYQRQALQDSLTLEKTIEEYLRLLSSVNRALSNRQRLWVDWQSLRQELQKKSDYIEKFRRQSKTQEERLNFLEREYDDAKNKEKRLKEAFDDITTTLKGELQRFDFEKTNDFRNTIEIHLEGAIETQKEIVEIWETFLNRIEKHIH